MKQGHLALESRREETLRRASSDWKRQLTISLLASEGPCDPSAILTSVVTTSPASESDCGDEGGTVVTPS